MARKERRTRTDVRTYHPVMEASRPPAGWYQDPGGAGMRYWNGSQWTQDVSPGHPVREGNDFLIRSRLVRGSVAAVGLLLLVFAVQAARAAVEEGWADGSFALVWCFFAACFAGGAVLCAWLALGKRPSR